MVAHGGGGTQLNYIYLVDLFTSILYGIQALLVPVIAKFLEDVVDLGWTRLG